MRIGKCFGLDLTTAGDFNKLQLVKPVIQPTYSQNSLRPNWLTELVNGRELKKANTVIVVLNQR